MTDTTGFEYLLSSKQQFWTDEVRDKFLADLCRQSDEFIVEAFRACVSVAASRMVGSIHDSSMEGWHYTMKRALDLMKESIN